eukprot:scaffold9.g3258.t1
MHLLLLAALLLAPAHGHGREGKQQDGAWLDPPPLPATPAHLCMPSRPNRLAGRARLLAIATGGELGGGGGAGSAALADGSGSAAGGVGAGGSGSDRPPMGEEVLGSPREQWQRSQAALQVARDLEARPLPPEGRAVVVPPEQLAPAAAAAAAAAARRRRRAAGGSEDAPPPPPRPLKPRPFRVWVLSLIRANYHSPELLRHWIRHYTRLGVSPSNIIMIVNFNPAAPSLVGAVKGTADVAKAGGGGAGEGWEELDQVLAVLEEAGVGRVRLWFGQFEEGEHYRLQLRALFEDVRHMLDWVVLATVEEFQVYVTLTLQPFLESMGRQGYNWLRAFLEDRVAGDGDLGTRVAAEPSPFRQFPLRCGLLASMGRRRTVKVAAMRAYWRADMGAHKLVLPFEAAHYLNLVSSQLPPPGEDLFALTPYSRYHMRYWYMIYPPENIQLGGASAKLLFWPRRASMHALSQHFAWRAGAAPAVRDSLDFYIGACNESTASTSGSLRHREFMGLARLAEVVVPGRIDTKKYKCTTQVHNPPWLAEEEAAAAAQQQAAAAGAGGSGAS